MRGWLNTVAYATIALFATPHIVVSVHMTKAFELYIRRRLRLFILPPANQSSVVSLAPTSMGWT